MSQITPVDTSKLTFPDVMDLRGASLFLGLPEMRIRTLARDKQLPAEKIDSQWAFKKSDLETFKNAPAAARKSTSGKIRAEGKSFIITVPADKLESVKTALTALAIVLQPRYNTESQKAYQAKRKAEKAAAATAAKTVTPAPVTPVGGQVNPVNAAGIPVQARPVQPVSAPAK